MQQKSRTYNLKPINSKVQQLDYNPTANTNKSYAAQVERIEVPAVSIDVAQNIAATHKKVKKPKADRKFVFLNKCTAIVQNGIVDLIKIVFLTGLIVRRIFSKIGQKIADLGTYFKGALHYFKWKTSKAENRDELFTTSEISLKLIEAEKRKGKHVEENSISLVDRFIEFDKKLLTAFFVLVTGIPKNEVAYPINDKCRQKIFRAFSARTVKLYIPAACVVLIGSVIYSARDYTIGIKAYIDEQEVAILKNEEEYDAVLKRIGNYVSSISGKEYTAAVTPTFKAAVVNKKSLGTYTALEDIMLLKAEDIIHETNGLYVDGVLVASNPDKTALEQALVDILEKNKTDNKKVEFIQDIRVERVILPRDEEKSIDQIKAVLTSTVAEEATYTVAKADVLGTIAPKFNMSVTELKTLNPSVNDTKLKAGEEIVIAKQKQYLAVKSMETITYTQNLPFKTEVVKDDSLYTNTTKVKQKGKNGEVEIVAEIVSIDGEQLSRNVVRQTVTAEPVNQIELKGTKIPPPKSSTGNYTSPVSGGVVSSRYGVQRGSKYHTGLDIALPTGSTIVAADGGVVTFSGWSGGYGYMIKIQHSNGQETVYGHCSKLLATKGQKVGKGEPIARVGSTGNSTGPHVHFEIRINGKTVNPAPYIGR